jgi:predicted MFS family arabinose efflux permease
VFALGSLAAAIPLITATRGWRRRPLLMLCIIGFFVFNSVTALSSNYALTLVARFFAGVSSGVVWGMTAGYARRLVPESMMGRAMAVVTVGVPLALTLGVPAGTFLGGILGWRSVFWIMSLLSFALVVWMVWKLPDFPGQAADKRLPLHKVFVTPGVRPVLFVVLVWVLAHSILYTYIAPFLAKAGLAENVDLVLFIFGVTSVVGIWAIGIWIDRRLRALVMVSLCGFVLASVLLGIGGGLPAVTYLGVVLWGLTYGGAGTLLQTAIADAAGENADVAQSMLVTAWNLAIGGGGVIGGIFLETLGVGSSPWALCVLALLALMVSWRAKKHGFRAKRVIENRPS